MESKNKGTPQEKDFPTIVFERRRYGRTTYCWAYIQMPDGTEESLGDPWPAINWPKAVLHPLARAKQAELAGDHKSAAMYRSAALQAQLDIHQKKQT